MNLINLIIIVFALFALSRLFLRIKEKAITKGEFFFWGAIWTLLIIFAVSPRWTDLLSKPLGIERGIDLIIYFSVILLLYMIFRIYVRIENMDKTITTVIRHIAKEKTNKKDKDISNENREIRK